MGVEISSPPGTVTGEGETPSHPAKDNFGLSGKGKSGATGEGETPSHPAMDNFGLSGKEKSGATARRKLRATRYWADSGASGLGKSPVPPGKRETRKEEPRATGAGKTSRYVAEGKPRVA
jgi:hypothetical protein